MADKMQNQRDDRDNKDAQSGEPVQLDKEQDDKQPQRPQSNPQQGGQQSNPQQGGQPHQQPNPQHEGGQKR